MFCKNVKFFNLIVKGFNSFSRNMSAQPPRRAILYVPGDNEKLIQKVLTIPSVDCVVFDCEDGVAHNRKEDARNRIKKIFNHDLPNLKNIRRDWAVRVNSLKSGLLANDLETIFSETNPLQNPKTIFLPKVDKPEDVEEFSALLTKVVGNQNERINLIFYCESCESVLNIKDICKKLKHLSSSECNFMPAGIVFGSDDFLANLGATRDVSDSSNILYARQKIVLTAKAFGLQAIDMVYINFKDLDGLKLQCLEGSKMGYTGKQTIHPAQVPIVQEAFMPAKHKVEWAKKCLDAYKEHQNLGKGAFVFENQMIDNPTVEQAINILKLAELTNKRN
ncbi:citramalyl-CoA lyase, mitochondrial-like [Condylostylus longicornis]|uniref:citramalyl-CoA lyase, mitochondrial-like n=1 Tax=Condylostylus longicornis TaxID=2530218 RepID=UPI00244DAA29|nr:citramalyl-CoA lyase, mitochondrial-like [Condylostylus longicornis]